MYFFKKYVCQFDYGKRKENILLKVFVNQYWMNQVLVLVCGFLNVYGSYFFSSLFQWLKSPDPIHSEFGPVYTRNNLLCGNEQRSGWRNWKNDQVFKCLHQEEGNVITKFHCIYNHVYIIIIMSVWYPVIVLSKILLNWFQSFMYMFF